jgi:hypothetical protein
LSKYRNKRTEVDGIKFDSMREALRYGELKLLQRAKQAHDLQVHVRYKLVVNGIEIAVYEADFVYVDVQTGRLIVEDVKPHFTSPARKNAYQATAAYRTFALKKRLMLAIHKIEVIEV